MEKFVKLSDMKDDVNIGYFLDILVISSVFDC